MDACSTCSPKDVSQSSEHGGRQLWHNGRFKEAYAELGHCLGSGGMGTVWAARVSDAASSRYKGRWVAVKAIPILLPQSREPSALHQGLRECLSTFQDLSSAHVVRYETYWLEEPEHLPEAMQQLHLPRPAQLKKEVEEDPAWVSSLRFRGRAGTAGSSLAFRRTRSSSDVYPTPPGLDGSLGFIWEVDSLQHELSRPSTPPPARVVWQDKVETKQVVLLIEMELMGSAPDGSISDDRQTLTLRSWLKLESRTLSDAADVFGSLMLSVRHIHRKRIVHSDLKPDNIFCVAERSKVKVVRIGDFGLAGENQLFRQFDQLSSKMLKNKTAMGGTPGYTAPEILLCARHGPSSGANACSDKVDIYSCAVILLELLLQPFRTHMERISTMDKFNESKIVPGYVAVRLPKTRCLLQEMAESDPAARLSAEEVCKRFEKEVRKELCRSASQLCCDSNPAFEKCSSAAQGEAKSSP
ncbi:unnamed protein product [Durusdinium trenchii]|uniref:non-specific serine/threonine protein kinase n=1 Tax=Durusdinium trenchii TaxID=1381693 RepID=A0ABP0SP68_9DINO